MNLQTISRSAHQTPNFTNPEFQFPQFKVLQIVCFYYNELLLYFDIKLKLLSGKSTQKVNKKKYSGLLKLGVQ